MQSSIIAPNLSQPSKPVVPKKWFEIEQLKNEEYCSSTQAGRSLAAPWSNDTLTWSDHINMVCAKVSHSVNFPPVSLGFFLSLFYFSSLNLTFDYCDVVWSGCTKSEASRLETLLNNAYRTVLRKCKGSSTLAAHRELGLSTLAYRRNLHLCCYHVQLYVFQVPSLSKYLSFFLRLHPTTTPAPLHLPSSTFHPIDPPLAKNHLVSWAQNYGNPCHRTSETLETSLGITHSASDITINDI